jgi:hypothetical protein
VTKAPAPRFLALRAVLAYLAARRALLPFVGCVLYLVLLGVKADHGAGGRPFLFGLPALLVAYLAASPSLPGNGLGEDGRREVGAVAYASFALALVLASLDSDERELTHDLGGTLGAFLASVTAGRAMARARGAQGVAESLPKPGRGLAAATLLLVATGYVLAILASLRAMSDPEAAHPLLPADLDGFAAAAALLVLGGSAWETLRWKRLILDVGDRLTTALGILVGVAIVAASLLVLDVAAPDRLLGLALAAAALLVTYVCLEGDAETHARRGRRAVTLLLFGGPGVLLGGLAARGPGRSAVPLLVTGLVSLGVGSALTYLELPLRRAEGHLLDAIASATRALVRADPETSLREALAALRTLGGALPQSPELWMLTPPRVMTIDGAGYPHEREAKLPELLLATAKDEPEATVRTELLNALVVRRPDLRPLARWMDERDALSATLVTRGGEVEGVLVFPRGARRVPMSLEEVRAQKRLADAFAGASASHAALERSQAREDEARKERERALSDLEERERELARVAERDRRATSRLAALAEVGPYAPGARLVFEAMQTRAERDLAMVVVAPHGSDVLAFLARAHLGGKRAGRPLVVVDGASVAEHELARWQDAESSPLALAHGGALVLLDGLALPAAVQERVGTAIARKRAPWGRRSVLSETDVLDVLPILVSREEPDDARLEPALGGVLGEARREVLVWPRLCDRGEDLRSLVLALLGREGLRVHGAPLGIEDAAFALLSEYEFPGDVQELRALLLRALLRTEKQEGRGLVRAKDVRAVLGLG